MSEPWPPAFMRTAPPTEPGTPDRPGEPAPACIGHAAGQHRERRGRAGPHHRGRPAGARIGRVMPAKPRPAAPPPVEARVRHQHVGSPARGRRRAEAAPTRRVRRTARRTRPGRRGLDLDGEGGRARRRRRSSAGRAAVERGPRAQGLRPGSQGLGRASRRLTTAAPPAARRAAGSDRPRPGSGTGRRVAASRPTAGRNSSQPGGVDRRGAAGPASRTASATRRPDTPGTGRSPAL